VSKNSDPTPRLIEILQGPEEPEGPNQVAYRRSAAADALASLGDPVAVPALVEALKDKNYVSVCAAAALAKIRDPRAVEPLIAVLRDQAKFWVPRGAAAVALGDLGEMATAALPALRESLEYDCDGAGEKWDLRAREAVADAIAHIADASAVCSLKGKGSRYEMWGLY
jgi:HEAT repeat protein